MFVDRDHCIDGKAPGDGDLYLMLAPATVEHLVASDVVGDPSRDRWNRAFNSRLGPRVEAQTKNTKTCSQERYDSPMVQTTTRSTDFV